MLLHEYRFILIFDGDEIPEGFKGNGHYCLGSDALDAHKRLLERNPPTTGMRYVLDTDQCPWRPAVLDTSESTDG